MTIIAIIFISVSVLYALQGILLLAGLARTRYTPDTQTEPTVSVVVAARNEELNIGRCLASLTALDYPQEKLEIIVVNDQSTDRTAEIVEEAARAHSNVRLVNAQPASGGIHGKANALAQGIDHASGEIVMMTDADCTAHPHWVRKTVQYFAPHTGIIAGFTLLDVRSWFGGMQSLDLAYILGIGAAAIGLRMPMSCIGNNFSVRRKAYLEVGGYRGIPFSVTEDFALFKAIVDTGHWDYRFPFETETLITSQACDTWTDLYRQKRRWAVGGKDIQSHGILLFIIGAAVHVLMIAQLIAPSLMSWSAFGAGALIKIAADFLFLNGVLARTRHRHQLKYFLLFELYFLVYVTLLPLIVFLGGKVVWKERKL